MLKSTLWTKAKLLTLALGASLLFSGCGADLKAFGVARRPFITELPALSFSATELDILSSLQRSQPDLFRKLQQHSNANADAIHAYNLDALVINSKQEIALGATKEEVAALVEYWRARYNIKDDKQGVRP